MVQLNQEESSTSKGPDLRESLSRSIPYIRLEELQRAAPDRIAGWLENNGVQVRIVTNPNSQILLDEGVHVLQVRYSEYQEVPEERRTVLGAMRNLIAKKDPSTAIPQTADPAGKKMQSKKDPVDALLLWSDFPVSLETALEQVSGGTPTRINPNAAIVAGGNYIRKTRPEIEAMSNPQIDKREAEKRYIDSYTTLTRVTAEMRYECLTEEERALIGELRNFDLRKTVDATDDPEKIVPKEDLDPASGGWIAFSERKQPTASQSTVTVREEATAPLPIMRITTDDVTPQWAGITAAERAYVLRKLQIIDRTKILPVQLERQARQVGIGLANVISQGRLRNMAYKVIEETVKGIDDPQEKYHKLLTILKGDFTKYAESFDLCMNVGSPRSDGERSSRFRCYINLLAFGIAEYLSPQDEQGCHTLKEQLVEALYNEMGGKLLPRIQKIGEG